MNNDLFTPAQRKNIIKLPEKIHKETNFTRGECEALMEHFYLIPKKHSEKLDRADFRDILHTAFRFTDDVIMDRIFRAFDKDSDGNISPEEWIRGLSVFLLGSLREKTEFSFVVYDLNSDGLISREEMFQLLKATLIKQPTEEDPDEGVRELVELCFKKLDYDRDQRLTFDDFMNSVSDEPLMCEVLGTCLPDYKSAAVFLSTFQESRIRNTFSYRGRGDSNTGNADGQQQAGRAAGAQDAAGGGPGGANTGQSGGAAGATPGNVA